MIFGRPLRYIDNKKPEGRESLLALSMLNSRVRFLISLNNIECAIAGL